MRLAVIISTFNSPDWLEKVLWGYSRQTLPDFRIVIADDGSDEATRERIDQMREHLGRPLDHQWHHSPTYARQTILNRCLAEVDADYIVMTDGDCIPMPDFLEVHARHARPGRFLSGGYCKLSMEASRQISRDDILSGRCFEVDWLRRHGPLVAKSRRKLRWPSFAAGVADRLTTTRATWNNMNSSGWLSDLRAVNGYDERMLYGGSDRELGERLVNSGLRAFQVRHRALVIHLDHSRGYADEKSAAFNRCVRDHVAAHKVVRTPFGIEPFADPLTELFQARLAKSGLSPD
jgi:glycosyltransferase involved in cell wall biosynthesis